ncbi:MAG: hypothetical protein KDJ90_00725 [Nitratireductor sp.]|nr:hypothetical protein [Nitratireductor sp.]
MTDTLSKTPAYVQIGKRRFAFTTYEKVSEAYCETRDRLDATASGRTGPLAPQCTIHAGDGEQLAHVSYNGKVWAGDARDWFTGKEPISNPYA